MFKRLHTPQIKTFNLTKKLSNLFLSALFLLVSATHASAAVLKLNADNQLIGVEGLQVRYLTTGGTVSNTYNLDFVVDTFANVYGTQANPLRPFDFGTAEAQAIRLALRNSVFIDSSLGNFDTNPSLTTGCPATGSCLINLPTNFVQNSTSIQSLRFTNRDTDVDGTSAVNSDAVSRIVGVKGYRLGV